MPNQMQRKMLKKAFEHDMKIFSSVFVNIYFYVATLSLATFFLLSSYLNLKGTEFISYLSIDGQCNPSIQGIGMHCFGDFYFPVLQLADSPHPWTHEADAIAYSPIAIWLFKPFTLLNSLFGGYAALSAFLLISLVCAMFPIWHATYKLKLLDKSYFGIAIFMTFMSVGTLSAIDRGNNNLFLLPLCYLFLAFRIKHKINLMMFMLILISILKPQFFILSIFLLIEGEVKKFFSTLVLSAFSTLLPFFAYGENSISNLRAWFHNLVSFPQYAETGQLFPINFSLSNVFALWSKIFEIAENPGLIRVFTLLLGIILFLFVAITFNKRDCISNFIYLLFFPILFGGTTYAYYASTLNLVLLLILISGSQHGSQNPLISKILIFRLDFKGYLLIVAVILLTIPVMLPLNFFTQQFETQGTLISFQWMVGPVLLISTLLIGLISDVTNSYSKSDKSRKYLI